MTVPLTVQAVAVSDVGKVRSNNQDSGYAGRRLFLVADGMGGHAGGDVASAVALRTIVEADQVYADPEEAREALTTTIRTANRRLGETVQEHPELTGMGTTVSALARVGDKVVIAHIGDSRVYLLRDGALEQVTTDHTFVQHLVDSGRITPAEALVHPRRSVLMRVLGDVNATPEIDTAVVETRPGDRWLLCSDGLSGVVGHERLVRILDSGKPATATADSLVAASLDAGAPDNVTVVVVDVLDANDASTPAETPDPVTVGSASGPLAFEPSPNPPRPAMRIPSLRLHPRAPVLGPSHFESQTQEYLDELVAEGRRRVRRRRLTWLFAVLVLLAAIAAALWFGYRWTQTRYYVGVSDTGNVSVFQGVQQSIGPISLSHVYEESDVSITDLPPYDLQQLTDTINADSLADARRIVKEVTGDAVR